MKITHSIRIKGQGIWIPGGRIDVQTLVNQGKLSQEEFDEQQYISLYHDEKQTSRSEALVVATKEALHDANISSKEIGLTVFASFTGKDKLGWSQSADLNRKMEISKAQFIDVYQGCSGILAATEIALSKLMLDPVLKSALVIGADALTVSEKWNMDYQTFYGDGAGAWILAKEKGPFQILSICGQYDSGLNEFIYAQDDSFNLKPSKEKFLTQNGIEKVYHGFNQCTEKVYAQCLDEAGISASDISYVVAPNFSRKLLEKMMLLYGKSISQSTWEFGRQSGHMATVDPIVNLYQAKKNGRIQSGDNVLIVAHGAGISVLCMIVKV